MVHDSSKRWLQELGEVKQISDLSRIVPDGLLGTGQSSMGGTCKIWDVEISRPEDLEEEKVNADF